MIDAIIQTLENNIVTLKIIRDEHGIFMEAANKMRMDDMYYKSITDVYGKIDKMQKSMAILEQMKLYCLRK
ncbi:MAG: hypothetical protein M0R51_17660 [Clostridia bacterium]|jgi:hypothetical protein|nr:hypothetical protein [Clostridia bacterium]